MQGVESGDGAPANPAQSSSAPLDPLPSVVQSAAPPSSVALPPASSLPTSPAPVPPIRRRRIENNSDLVHESFVDMVGNLERQRQVISRNVQRLRNIQSHNRDMLLQLDSICEELEQYL
jgi:hypothetical protein